MSLTAEKLAKVVNNLLYNNRLNYTAKVRVWIAEYGWIEVDDIDIEHSSLNMLSLDTDI